MTSLTPILWIEISAAILIAVAIIWTRVEYGLFLYAFALGFPDFAWPVGATINVRVDDVLILILLARTFLWTPAEPAERQKKLFVQIGIFFAACLLSIAVESGLGTPPGGYETAKMAGCAAIFLVLPRVVQSDRRLRAFLAGLMGAGVAIVVQIHMHLGESTSNGFANFQELKSAATFSTWNPNTVGQASMLLVFGAGLGAICFSRSFANRILWPFLATGFAIVPALLFVRGTSLSIAAGFLLFLFLARRWRFVLLFAATCLCVALYLHARSPRLLEAATAVNVATGEGFSHRFDRWDMAFQAVQARPLLGQGFGQELPYLTLIGSEGRAHDAYLAIWLELGLGGLLLFLAALFQFVRAGLFLFRNSRFRSHGALILALMFALSLDSLGLPTLYWEKLPTIALSLAIAVVGICERHRLEFANNEVSSRAWQPVFRLP